MIIGIAYAVLTFTTIGYYLVTSCTNPTDPTILLERVCNYNELSFHSSNYEYYCNVCSSCVLQGSKHCAYCNRCVSGFDHHSHTFNNCIGDINYHLFYKTLHFAMWFTVANMCISGYTIVDLQSEYTQKEVKIMASKYFG